MTNTFIIDYQDLTVEHKPVLSNTGNHCVVIEVVWQNVSWHLWSWQNDIDIQLTEDCLTAYLLSNIIFHNIGVFGKYHCVYIPDMQNATAMPHLYFQYCVHNNDMRCNWKWFMALLTLTHWAEAKWTPLRRRHFQVHILERKCMQFDQSFTEVVPMAPINNIPALVQIMAWRRPGDKPLSEPMRRIYASLGLNELKDVFGERYSIHEWRFDAWSDHWSAQMCN